MTSLRASEASPSAAATARATSDKARRFSLECTPKIVRLLALAIHAAIRPVRARHPSACDDRPGVFRFLLKLEDSDPPDSAVLVTPVPNWTVGETFSTGRGHEWRILAIDTDIDKELVDRGISAVFTVAPGVDVC